MPRLPRKIDLRTRLREHYNEQHSETVASLASPHAEQGYPSRASHVQRHFSYFGSFLTKLPLIIPKYSLNYCKICLPVSIISIEYFNIFFLISIYFEEFAIIFQPVLVLPYFTEFANIVPNIIYFLDVV